MMMRRCDYDGKMEEMMGTGTYGKLRGDPTATQENRLSHKRREEWGDHQCLVQ